MVDKEMLESMRQMMREELQPINKRLDQMQEDIQILKEDTKITRNSVNTILEWADDASIQVVPLFKKAK